MAYDPQKYWERRGGDYNVSADTTRELDNLRQLVTTYIGEHDHVLEIGPGYGRIFQHLLITTDIQRGNFYLCDFVDSMRHECEQRTGRLPDSWDGITLPYADRSFDFVISFSVMLHVPPADIIQHFRETCRVSRKFVYIATYNGGQEGVADHCFSHPYLDYVYAFGMRVVDRKEFMDGLRVNYLLEKVI